MTTRQSIWVFCLALAVGLLGLVSPAPAETLKCKGAGMQRVQEGVPVGDVEGHYVGVNVRAGMAFCDTGEILNYTTLASWNIIPGGGEAQGYQLWNFVDGSTMLSNFQQKYGPSADPNFVSESNATGEILSGTGRFAGIKGSLTFTGKNLKPIKGEPGGRSALDFTFTYTLPPK